MKNLIVGCIASLAAVASLPAVAVDYYWTGAADAGQAATNFFTVGNWALADGTPATAKPGKTTTVIFTNDVPLKLSYAAETTLYGCRFHGADVDASAPSSDGDLTLGAGGVVADGGGTYQLGWHLTFTANEDHVIDVATGSTFVCVRQITASTTSRVTKRGGGTFRTKDNNAYFRFSGALTFEEGLIYDAGYNSKFRDALGLSVCVSGTAAKTFYVYGKSDSNTGFGTTGHFSIAEGAEDSVFKIAFETSVARVFKIYGDQTDTTFNADLVNQGGSTEGNRTFLWAPNDASTTLTYIRKTLDSTKWGISITNGIMAFADGAQIRELRQIEVDKDGQFVIADDAGADFSGAPFVFRNGGKLKSDRYTVKLQGVTVDGIVQPAGIYTAANAPWLEGKVIVVVGTPTDPETTEATWVGGQSDTSISNADNWAGGTLPDLTSGSLVATFPAAATVTIPVGRAWLKGVRVEDGAAGDMFSLGGVGELWLGSSGVATESVDGAGKLSFGCGLVFALSQTWQVGVANSITFTDAAELSSLAGAVWTSRGAAEGTTSKSGALVINCSNPKLGDSTLYHAVTVAADCALGGPGATVTVDARNRPTLALTMKNCTLRNKEVIVQNINNNTQNRGWRADTGVCVVKGKAYSNATSQNLWECATGAELRFEGGLSAISGTGKGPIFYPKYDGYDVHVTNVAAQIRKFALGKSGTFSFETADNMIYRGIHISGAGAKMRTAVPNAFKLGDPTKSTEAAGVSFTANGTWDLCNCDQQVQILCGTAAGKVTSENDAVVRLHDDVEYAGTDDSPNLTGAQQHTNNCVFAGGAGLVKDGPLTHYYCGVSTSTGRVEVVNGNLVFAAGASWVNTSAVKVSGTGVLTVPDGKVFGRGAAMTIDTAEGASVEIPAGQVLRVASLTVDGTPVKGAYKGVGVTGGGEIFAGKPGLVLIVQ